MVSRGNQFLSFLEMLLVLLPFLFLLFRLLGLCILRRLALGSGFLRLRLELRHVGDQPRGFLHRPGDGLQESGIQFLRNSLEGQRDNVVLGFVFQPV